MLLRFAILGLLVDQPRHGYAIQAALEERFAELLDPSPGDVYRALSALERAGWIARSSARVGRRPERKVYAPTDSGRIALAAWLRGGESSQGRASADALWLRLLVAERVAPQEIEGLVDGALQRERAALAERDAEPPRLRAPASFTSLVLVLRRECDVRGAQARLDGLALCARILARRRRGVALSALLRDVADARRAAAGRATGSRPASAG